MVKTVMSSDLSEPEETDTLATLSKAKEKLIIQQSLINSSARTLQRLKESTSRLISTTSSSNINGLCNGESQSAIDDDIKLQENKLMKGFSNQLVEKHRYVKFFLEELEGTSDLSVEKVKSEFDRLIDLQQFLNVAAGLQPGTTKALLEVEPGLTLDLLFSMINSDLEQLMARCYFAAAEGKKLLGALDHLTTYYETWERGEKPSVSTPSNRLGSTSSSSRLNSISNLTSLDHDSRCDSISSSTSTGTSPLPLNFPTSSTPAPLTPSSSQSLLSPSSPFTMALASSTPQNSTFTPHHTASTTAHIIPVHSPPPPPLYNQMNRSYSSSSTMLLGESDAPRTLARGHHSVSSLSNGRNTQGGMSAGGGVANREERHKPPLTHKRSLSNPPSNIILDQPDENTSALTDSTQSSSQHAPPTSKSSLARYSYRSPSPPSRAGSQPSMFPGGQAEGSPQPRNRHPQMRRISAIAPSFSQSLSNDQLIPSAMTTTAAATNSSISGSESALWDNPGTTPRCNSMAGMSRPKYSESSDLTSASMVDLPVGLYGGSTEHLNCVEERNLPPRSSVKSQSVPRLTLMTVSTDERGVPSGSNPASPRTPGTYTPTRHMRHAIMHRFSTKPFITPHVCDYCKKTVMMGVRCKDCKYKCHRGCAAKAPANCGLPQELMNYFRKHMAITSSMERLADQRVESSIQSPSERSTPRPPMERSNTYDLDTRDTGFLIQDLTSEPTNFHYSPIMVNKRTRAETINGVIRRHELSSQSSSTSLLEVPHTNMPRHYHSTSSTPSSSPPTSPSLTPSSPRSPNEYTSAGYSHYHYPAQRYYAQRVYTKRDEESDDCYESESSAYSSEYSSTNDVSDQSRVLADTPQGTRPGPQIILAKSLPDLLSISPTESDLDKSCSKFLETPREQKEGERVVGGGLLRPNAGRRVSMDSHNYHHGKIRRKESLVRTLSTADSKASTLVASVPVSESEEEEDDSDSYIGSQEPEDDREYKPGRSLQHRNSVVDEWSIPYKSIRITETIGRSRVSRGYWHGEVAIKHFPIPNATEEQVTRFKEEVSILKKTRHENLVLFMGASLVPPDLAIVTMFCRGPTLYKYIHIWSEPMSIDKSIDLAKQVAQAMGYLHARYIVHKNLNTRNIFLENERNKVVISDTGLSTINNNFCIERNGLVIRHNKLFYLAPELMRKLSPIIPADREMFEHTEETDIYAFGTVLYELMMRRFPLSSDPCGFSIPPLSLIYLIGNGYRPEMSTRETPKRMQDLINDCWHPDPSRRLPFKTIHDALGKLSRKKTPITRSPSFPITLSKSSEGLNFLNA